MLQILLATTYIAGQNPDFASPAFVSKIAQGDQIIIADNNARQIQTLEQINAELQAKKVASQPFDDKDVKVDIESLGLDSVDLPAKTSSEVKEVDLPLPATDPQAGKIFDFTKTEEKPQPDNLSNKVEIKAKPEAETVEQKNFGDFLSRIQSAMPNKKKKSAKSPNAEEQTKEDKPADIKEVKKEEIKTEEIKKDDQAPLSAATSSDVKKPTKKYIALLKKRNLKKRLELERRKANVIDREKREKAEAEKLEKLRAEYLIKIKQEDADEIDVELYNDASKIVPRKKEIGKYLSYELPAPPILNRYRSTENTDIPTILTKKERVDILFSAAASNDTSYFDSAYNDIQQPNVKNTSGDTILTYVTLLQKYNIMASMLKKGADPNMANSLGYTPLAIAIERSDPQAVNLLVNNNADFKYVDKFGRTYLMQAARVGSLPIVDLLVSKGLDVNAIDKDGFTALSVAYRNHKEVIVQYLLKRNAKTWVEKPYDSNSQSLINELENRW